MSEEDSASARRWSPLQAAARPCTALGELLRGSPAAEQYPSSKAALIPLPPSPKGLPLHQAAGFTNDVLAGVKCRSLALKGVLRFERAWPHQVASADGRIAAINLSTSAEIVGHSVSSIFKHSEDKEALFTSVSCSNVDSSSWFAFQGAINGSSFQMVVGPAAFHTTKKGSPAACALLELVALPLDQPPQRGAVAWYDTSDTNLSPQEHVTDVLRHRLSECGREQGDHAVLAQGEVSEEDGKAEDFDDEWFSAALGVPLWARPPRNLFHGRVGRGASEGRWALPGAGNAVDAALPKLHV